MLGKFHRFVGLAFAVVTIMFPTTIYAQDITTCGDFEYQQDAQKFFDQGGGRPQDWYGGMDQDNDGIACENLPGKPLIRQSWFMPIVGVFGAAVVGVGAFFLRSRRKTIATFPPVIAQENGFLKTPMHQDKADRKQTSGENPQVMIVVNNDSRVESSSKTVVHNKSSTDIAAESWMTPEKARSMPYSDYLKSRYWQAVRKNNIARANGTCADCGRTNQVLQVHHLSYEYLGREDDRLLVVLCAGCHERRHDIPSPPSPRMNA